jgi:hypothetical protein
MTNDVIGHVRLSTLDTGPSPLGPRPFLAEAVAQLLRRMARRATNSPGHELGIDGRAENCGSGQDLSLLRNPDNRPVAICWKAPQTADDSRGYSLWACHPIRVLISRMVSTNYFAIVHEKSGRSGPVCYDGGCSGVGLKWAAPVAFNRCGAAGGSIGTAYEASCRCAIPVGSTGGTQVFQPLPCSHNLSRRLALLPTTSWGKQSTANKLAVAPATLVCVLLWVASAAAQPFVPADLLPGDHFQIVFVTSFVTNIDTDTSVPPSFPSWAACMRPTIS